MRTSFWLLWLVSLVAASVQHRRNEHHLRLASAGQTVPDAARLSAELIPNTYIVEFQDGLLARRDQDTRRATFFSALSANRIRYTVQHEFNSDVFKGATLFLANSTNIKALARYPHVKASYLARAQNQDGPVHRRRIFAQAGVRGRGASCVFQVATVNAAKRVPASLEQIRARGVHQKGVTGKGQHVAIVDSGFDYTHPALGGCLGSHCKVKNGYDFVGDTYGDSSFVPNDDPYSTCDGFIHGTAVAGLVAGLPADNGFSGVAPDASLSSYRVADCSGTSDTSLLLKGLMKAHSDGAKIIQLAVSAIGGWPEDVAAAVVDRLANAGVLTVCTTGDVPQGPFYTNSPATSTKALSVGSVQLRRLVEFTAVDDQHRNINYYGSHSFGSGKFGLYFTSDNTTALSDACSPLPASTPNLHGKIAIVRRGGCYLDEKASNLSPFNVSGILVYNDTPDAEPAYEDGIYYGFPSGNMGLMSEADGLYLFRRAKKGKKPTLSFKTHFITTPNTLNTSDAIFSSSSQYGPTFELTPSPKVVAPGDLIFSLAPVNFGSYTVVTGTSFAAPQVAGSVALYAEKVLRAGSKQFVKQAVEAFTANARPFRNPQSEPRTATVVEQGAGVIDVYKTIFSRTQLSPSFLLLNDTRFCKGRQTFTIKNTSGRTVTYKIANVPSSTMQTHAKNSIYPLITPTFTTQAISAHFSRGKITLKSGHSADIHISFHVPDMEKSTFPIFSGYIRVRSTLNEQHTIPYMGMAAALIDMPVLDTKADIAGAVVPFIADSNNTIQTGPQTYTFADGDEPSLYSRFLVGTAKATIELMQANTTYVPSIPHKAHRRSQNPKSGFVGTLATTQYSARNGPSSTLASGSSLVSHFAWAGDLDDGTVVADGAYRIRLRALKITGDEDSDGDYEWVRAIVQDYGIQCRFPDLGFLRSSG